MKKTGIVAAVIGLLLIAAGAAVRMKESASIGIIGGADGPTAIFVAGDGVAFAAEAGIALGVVILIAAVVRMLKKRK